MSSTLSEMVWEEIHHQISLFGGDSIQNFNVPAQSIIHFRNDVCQQELQGQKMLSTDQTSQKE